VAKLKTCSSCKEEKPLNEFHKQAASPDGHGYRCKECAREYQKIYHKKNKEKHNEAGKIWRENHREEISEYGKTYRENNPEKCAEKSNRRRALKMNANIIENIDRLFVYERDGGRCHMCKRKVNRKNWHLDHIVPLSKGGDHSYKNVAVSCLYCNLSKGNTGSSQLRMWGQQ